MKQGENIICPETKSQGAFWDIKLVNMQRVEKGIFLVVVQEVVGSIPISHPNSQVS